MASALDPLKLLWILLTGVVMLITLFPISHVSAAIGDSNWFYDWVWKPLLVNVSAGLMSLAGMILTIAGSLFDLLIQYVIIGFGQTLKTFGLDTSINLIWAVFRDIANILIIGMFVFIAIATILSIESYGVRKWIVRLLLVAVFLNFSMFLTQLTIDTSNYVAFQLYRGLDLSGSSQNSESLGQELQIGGVDLIAKEGIASTFVTQIGLSGVWDANVDMLDKMAKENIWVMFGYALTASILLVAVGLILLYGCFLIATRAILLLFLLLTSSVAVASILLPGDLAKQGWGKWKESLINAAVFAPLIMVFLFMVITILNGAHGREGALGLKDYLDNPTNGNAWDAILIFIFATGLLYASFKFAGDFAKKIGGFAEAATAPALLASLSAGAAGLVGRRTIGRAAIADRARLERIADAERQKDGKVSDKTMAAIRRRDWLGNQSFDARQTKPFQSLIKQSSLSKVAAATPFLSKEAAKELTDGHKNGFAKDREAAVKKEAELITEKAKAATAGAKQYHEEAEKRVKEFADASKGHGEIEAAATTKVTNIDTSIEEARRAGRTGQVVALESQRRYAQKELDDARAQKAAGIEALERVKTEAAEVKKRTSMKEATAEIAEKSRPTDFFSQTRRAVYDIDPSELAKSLEKKAKEEDENAQLKKLLKLQKEEESKKPEDADKKPEEKKEGS